VRARRPGARGSGRARRERRGGWRTCSRAGVAGEHYVGIWGAGGRPWVSGLGGMVVTAARGARARSPGWRRGADDLVARGALRRPQRSGARRRGMGAGGCPREGRPAWPCTAAARETSGSSDGRRLLELAGGAGASTTSGGGGAVVPGGDDPLPELSLFGVFARSPTTYGSRGFSSERVRSGLISTCGSGWRRKRWTRRRALRRVARRSDVWAVGARG
jgi:hypothetical protein